MLLKKILKINSDKWKSILVLVCFLALLSLFFYKNLEANLKGFYANRNFPGEIKINGFSWAEERTGIDVNFTYTEKINGKNISLPLKKSVRFKQLVMPYYDKIDLSDRYNPISELGTAYDESIRVYLPMIEKILEINPERTKLEESLTRKLNQAPDLSGASAKLRSTLSDQANFVRGETWYSDRIENATKNKHSILEELYDFSLNHALSQGAVYVQIILPKGVDREDIHLRDQIQQLLEQLSLPDGAYVLGTIDEAEGDFVVVEQGKIRERR